MSAAVSDEATRWAWAVHMAMAKVASAQHEVQQEVKKLDEAVAGLMATGLTHAEAADLLGLSRQRVGQLLRRARRVHH